MALTRRDVVRMGLASAGALALGPRARAAGSLHLGLVTYNVAKEWDLETLLRLVREAGLEGVEFRTTHAHGVERSLSPEERKDVKEKCQDAGLLQTSLGTVCEFHAPDPAVVARNVEDCREWVLLAKDIGARGVKVRPNGLPKDVPEEKTLEQIGRALAQCGAFARDHGVEIWVEVHGDQTKVPARMRRIMDVCSHPSVGLTWNSNDTDVTDGSVAASFAEKKIEIRFINKNKKDFGIYSISNVFINGKLLSDNINQSFYRISRGEFLNLAEKPVNIIEVVLD